MVTTVVEDIMKIKLYEDVIVYGVEYSIDIYRYCANNVCDFDARYLLQQEFCPSYCAFFL